MADVDTNLLANQHSDMRREASEHTNEVVRENMRGDFETLKAVKDNRYDISSRVENAADRIVATTDGQFHAAQSQHFDTIRDLSRLQATSEMNRLAIIDAVAASVIGSSKDTQLAVLQNTIEGQRNTQYLGDKIGTEGDRTRALLNELKFGDLNRALIERNSDLVDERHHARHWRGIAEQGQFLAMNSQFQAMNSQLQEARMGLVNFGTMSGGAGQQTSTANNVR